MNNPVNLGFKKIVYDSIELLKCWECGEPHMWRNYPRLSPSIKNSVQNLQVASIIGDIDRKTHKINATLDGRQVDHQSTIVEVEG